MNGRINVSDEELSIMRFASDMLPVADEMARAGRIKINYRKEALGLAKSLGRLLDMIGYPAGIEHIPALDAEFEVVPSKPVDPAFGMDPAKGYTGTGIMRDPLPRPATGFEDVDLRPSASLPAPIPAQATLDIAVPATMAAINDVPVEEAAAAIAAGRIPPAGDTVMPPP